MMSSAKCIEEFVEKESEDFLCTICLCIPSPSSAVEAVCCGSFFCTSCLSVCSHSPPLPSSQHHYSLPHHRHHRHHHITSPHLTSPHLISPHLTSPHLTSPHLTSPHLNHLNHLTHLTSHQPPPSHKIKKRKEQEERLISLKGE